MAKKTNTKKPNQFMPTDPFMVHEVEHEHDVSKSNQVMGSGRLKVGLTDGTHLEYWTRIDLHLSITYGIMVDGSVFHLDHVNTDAASQSAWSDFRDAWNHLIKIVHDRRGTAREERDREAREKARSIFPTNLD